MFVAGWLAGGEALCERVKIASWPGFPGRVCGPLMHCTAPRQRQLTKALRVGRARRYMALWWWMDALMDTTGMVQM